MKTAIKYLLKILIVLFWKKKVFQKPVGKDHSTWFTGHLVDLSLHVFLEAYSGCELRPTLGARSRTGRVQVGRLGHRLTEFNTERFDRGRSELHRFVVLRVLASVPQQLTLVVENHLALAYHAIDLNSITTVIKITNDFFSFLFQSFDEF